MAKDIKEKKNNKHFWKDFKAELKKVIWPTPKQLANNTIAVITIVIIVALIVFVLDFTFGKINSGINSGIKSIVDSKSTNSVDESESTNCIEIDAEEVEANQETEAAQETAE